MAYWNIKSLPGQQKLWYRSTGFRWFQLMLGLFIYGLSVAMMIRSGIGLGPWDAFHVGLHYLTGLSIGVASILVGLLIVGGTFLGGVRPGPGTLANMVFIGVFIDVLLPFIPPVDSWVWALPVYLLGIVLCGFATGLYIAAGKGKGPRDGLMIWLSERTGWPVRRVRTLIEMSVLAGGWLMGGTIGVGTILFTFLIGPATQWGLQLFGVPTPGAVRPAQPPPAPEAPSLCEAA